MSDRSGYRFRFSFSLMTLSLFVLFFVAGIIFERKTQQAILMESKFRMAIANIRVKLAEQLLLKQELVRKEKAIREQFAATGVQADEPTKLPKEVYELRYQIADIEGEIKMSKWEIDALSESLGESDAE